MGIYNDIKQVKRLTNGSLGAIIENSNNNFVKLSSAFKTFLENLSYDEDNNDVTFHAITSELISLTDSLTMNQNGVVTLLIDSQGRLTGKSVLVEVSQSKRHRFTEFPDRPDAGVLGEVIYTGPNSPTLDEGLWLYTEYAGWVRLDGDGGGTGECCELSQLPDVQLDSSPGPQDGDVLIYDAVLGKWTNGQVTAPAEIELVIDVTYSELESLVNTSQLKPYFYYRITDYATTGYIIGTTNTFVGDTEPIVVQATSTNTISNNAKSDVYPEDVISYTMDTSFTSTPISGYSDSAFWGPGPSYSLVPNFKGRITYRLEPARNIAADFDWRNWTFRMYKINAPVWTPVVGAALTEGGLVTYNGYVWMTLRNSPGATPPSAAYPWVKLMEDTYNFYSSFTLSDIGINRVSVPFNIDSSKYRDQKMIHIENDPSNASLLNNVRVRKINPDLLDQIGIGSGAYVSSVPIVTFQNDAPIVIQNVDICGMININVSVAFKLKADNCIRSMINTTGVAVDIDLGNLSSGVLVCGDNISTIATSQQFGNVIVSAVGSSIVKNFKLTGGSGGVVVTSYTTGGEVDSAGESVGLVIYDCEYVKLGRDCDNTLIYRGKYLELGNNVHHGIIVSTNPSYTPKYLKISDNVANLNLLASSFWSIMSSTAHKTIFKNASDNVRMSYYDSSDALVVVNPTV